MAILEVFGPDRAETKVGTSEMSIGRRVAGGLAWAGLVVVVAVPSADAITSVFIPKTDTAVSVVAPVVAPDLMAPTPAVRSARITELQQGVRQATDVASIKPVKPVTVTTDEPIDAAHTADAVDEFLSSGKPMPAYISGAQTAAVDTTSVKPIKVIPATTEIAVGSDTQVAAIDTTPKSQVTITTEQPGIDPMEVSSIGPQVDLVGPVPMPASMRPVGTPQQTYQVGDERPGDPVVLPQDAVVDESFATNDQVVTADELQGWNHGSLADYLAEQQGVRPSDDFSDIPVAQDDENGFFLDDGPQPRHHSKRQLIGPVDDNGDFFFPFLN
jgi:hypothetical protein